MGEKKSINSQLNQKIDRVESTLNKRTDGMQNDLSHNIDNVQYSISRLTNLNTVQEKRKFPSQPHQNPKGIHEVEEIFSMVFYLYSKGFSTLYLVSSFVVECY